MDFLLLTWIVWPVIGALVASRHGAWLAGLMLGMFLGPLGLLLAFFVDARPNCPGCGGRLPLKPRERGRLTADGFNRCPHCRTDLSWNGGTPAIAQ